MFERFSPSRVRILPQPSVDGIGGGIFATPSSPVLSKEAVALLEEMLPFYDRLAQQTGNDETLKAGTAEANRRVGAIRQRLGQFEEAVRAYGRAIALFDEMRTRSSANPNLDLEVARIRNELGRLYTSRQMVAQAHEAHEGALALLREGAGLPSAPAAMRFELARTYYFLGTQDRPLPAANARNETRPSQALNEQRENLAKAVAWLDALPPSPQINPDYRHLLALCYLEGAAVGEAPGSEARGGADSAIEILENLVQSFPGVPDYAYDLSEAYARIRIPRPPIPPGIQRSIEDRFGKAQALLAELAANHPDVPDYRAAEARLHNKLGAYYRQSERWAEAEQSFRKAISVQAPLVNQFADVLYYGIWMATFRISLADALLHRDQPVEARKELEETISTLLRQLEQTPGAPRPGDLLALGYSKLSTALRQIGERKQADEAAVKAGQERNALRP
jgi:tetratricopeptide (TPR) repeat protein